MKVYDALELAGRNLREAVLRNSLTTMGIAVGVASLVAMLALGIGLQQLANQRLGRSGLFNTVVVFPHRDVRGFRSQRQQQNQPPQPEQPDRALDDKARAEITKLPGVLETYPEIRFMAEVRADGKTQFASVAALPMSSRESDAFDTMQGKFFSSDSAQEAILRTEFARELNPNPAALLGHDLVLRYAERQSMNAAQNESSGDDEAAAFGLNIVPREQKLRVVGIIENEPYGGMRSFARGNVFITVGLAEKLNIVQPTDVRELMRSQAGENTADIRTYPSLIVRVASPNNVQAVEDAVKKLGFSTFSLLDATRSLRRFFAILDLFLGIFGSLALAVASLGIINTLVMAILERRREIGIMKALGASDGDVRLLFFAEAGAMGALGGAAGVLLGWAIGRAINFAANIYLERQQLPPEHIWSVPWWLVGGAIGFSLVISLVSGLYPAARASRLDPVQALRYE